MAEAWRLIVASRPASGFWNMAVDESLLAGAAQGAPPTLRLYAWSGPWLSLGHAQPFDGATLTVCRRVGVGVVRRVTGGRAVLHGADLTYAVTASERALPDGLHASYRVLSDALVDALRGLGIEAERVAAGAHRVAPDGGFDCFAEAADDEVCAGGRKLAGSAQRRAGGALLQHGSIRLAPDPPPAARIAGIGLGATSLAELGVAPGAARRTLAEALPKALGERLGVAFSPGSLAASERERAHRLAAALRRDPLARRAGPSSRAF
jgi:lipoyl(octanoyl) transferase